MKSTLFELKYPSDAPDRYEESNLILRVPILPAFAIEFTEFWVPDQLEKTQKHLVEGEDYSVDSDKLTWKGFEPAIFIRNPIYRLKVYHHGIRDYKLLFPHIEECELKQRLGDFYHEAEIAFENAAWLSFALMCGAVYEGVLFSIINNNKSFHKLIRDGIRLGVLDKNDSDIMDDTRKIRNIVHANKYERPYVSRLQALDMRTLLDKIIKRDWCSFKASESLDSK